MSAQDLLPGTLFAEDFQILRRLGTGDSGAVYVAEQISTGAQRALKVVAPQVAPDERSRLAFEQEARIGALIESEHTVLVVGAGLDPKTRMAWVAMELLDGVDLSARLAAEGPLPHDEVALLFGQLGSALGAAHAVGIAHGDLKPSNVFLARARGGDGRDPFCVKVLDFGVARLTLDPVSAAAGVRGTPLWMAPEQAQPDGPVGPPADVWAFGLMAFQALTGRSYWRAANAPDLDLSALVREITTEPLEPATARAARLGVELGAPGFDAWLARCLEREPGLRFQSAEAACAELLALLERPRSRPSSAPSAPLLSPAPGTAATGPALWARSTVNRNDADTSWFTAAAPAASAPPPPASPASPATAPPGVAPAAAAPAAPSAPRSPPAPRLELGAVAPHPPSRTARVTWPWIAVAALGLAAFAVLAVRWRAVTQPSPPAMASPATTVPAADAASAPLSEPVPADSVAPRAAQALLDQARAHATLVSFEGGSFAPGSFGGPRDERPASKVKIPAFAIEQHEVTVQDYALCVSARACSPAGTGAMCTTDAPQNAGSPVNCVSWKQARAYCEWIGRRLPTEAEWELAASGPGKRTYPWARGVQPGSTELCWQRCNGSEGPCPVGAFPRGATPEGLLDMAGNVEEWTASPYCPYDQPDCDSQYRVARGGGFCDSSASMVRTTARHPHPPNEVTPNLGMRCAVAR